MSRGEMWGTSDARLGCEERHAVQLREMLPKDDDKHVFLVEKWRDQEALDAHAKGPMPGNTYKDWIVGRKVARGAPAD